jgi:hypothetical protein
MSFQGAFTISQGTDASSFTLTDTSVGSDPNLTDRKIYLNKVDGTTLVPPNSATTFIDWPIASGPITLTGILNQDYSLNIQVVWVSSAPLPSPSTYVQFQLKTFTGNLELFDYTLTQQMAGNKLLASDNNYLPNKELLRLYIDNANGATSFNDQYNAQLNLNAGTNMQVNQNTFFA